MDMKPVKSSNIQAVGHEGGKLRVQFTNGSTYEYDDVPSGLARSLANAESPGSFFSQNIRGKYEHKKVGDDE